MSQLPFLPFSKPVIDEATISAVGDVLRSGWITSGPKVQAFEAQLSEFFGGRPVRTFNSGTCTMEIALRIAGVGAGHEVITTPLSWVATSNVILEVGATPVFADIEDDTFNLDPRAAAARRGFIGRPPSGRGRAGRDHRLSAAACRAFTAVRRRDGLGGFCRRWRNPRHR